MSTPELFTWLAVLATGALTVMVYWRRPPAPLWPSLFCVSFGGLLWTLGEAFSSFVVTTPRAHWIALVVEYTGVLLLPASWWLLALRFAELHGQSPRWDGDRARYGPLFLAFLAWLGLVTNPWHGLFITPVLGAVSEFRVIWYAQATMGYALMLGVSGLYIWMLGKGRDAVLREQLAIMLASSLVPTVCNLLYVSRLVDPGADLTAAGIGIAMLLFFAGIYRDRLFALSSVSLQHLIEHETDGMFIIDRHGRLAHFNPAAVRLLEGVTLTPDVELFPLLAGHLRAPDGGGSLSAEQIAGDLAASDRPPGGCTYPCAGSPARWLNIESVPIPDRAGRLRGTGLRLRDVTALREAQETVVEQAAVLEAILGSAEQGLLVVGEEGAMVYSNRAFREMWSMPEEIMSSGDEDLALPYAVRQVADPEAFVARVRELYYDPHAESREEIRLLDGRIFERSSRPLWKEGGIAGRLWSFYDVTQQRAAEAERRRLEQLMQQAQKMESLGILAGGIAHDFNNLLVGIVGNADLVLLSTGSDSPLRGPLQDILEASQRAAELTNQMLAYSGKGRFVLEAVDLSQLVEETSHLLEAVISKNASLELDLEAVPVVEGDATQLRQVVMNLITNASDALAGARGTVRVATRIIEADAGLLAGYHFGESLAEGSYVCFEVSDTGCGMDEATAARIFDPFFTTKFTGRGLGLASALGIVRAHRGAIQVDSHPGRGTTFRLLLPLSGREPRRGGAELGAVSETWRGSGTVLVVDDEPGVLRMATRVLERAGFDVLTAANGRAALERFPEHAEDIVAVIVDMTMPDLGGAETFAALRELGARVPIVLSSGYSEKEVRSGFPGAGPSDFLQKPYSSAGLLEVMQRVLEPPSARAGD